MGRHGFSLAELAIALAVASVLMLGMTSLWGDSLKAWSRMYDSYGGSVAVDGDRSLAVFDSVVRKSNMKCVVRDGCILEVYYSEASEDSSQPDTFARFYVTPEKDFVADYGLLDSSGIPGAARDTVVLARNATGVVFSVAGTSIQMVLSLADGDHSRTVSSCAMRHCE